MAELSCGETKHQLDANPQSHFVPYSEAIEQLVPIVSELSLARDLKTVMAIIHKAARKLTGADGASFVLREDDLCFYADEEAVAPLWRGQSFNMESCISGWVMLNQEPAVIEDIFSDERIPHGVHQSTFVKSLVMVPIRTSSPIGAIGAYWARKCSPPPEVVKILQALADLASSALRNIELYGELLRAKTEWERTFDSVPDLIAVLDTRHRIVRVNRKMSERLGVTPEQCMGMHCYEAVHCLSHPPELCPHTQTLRDGKEHVAEVHEERLGGDFLVSTTPLSDERGVLVGTVHVARDITERKRTEEALRQSEERFRTLADNISQFAWMADEKGWIFWYNKRWYDYTGTTLEEMRGWGWRKVHHPDHVERVVERIQRSWDTGEPWEDLFPLRGKDGEYRWFLSRALPIRDESGKIVQWFGTNTDITEQREAERALRESERQFRELAEALPEIVWFTRPDGYVEYLNERWSEFTGLTLEESRGGLWSKVLHPDDHERTLERWRQSLQDGEPYQIEYRFRRAEDGAYYWFLGHALPVRDERGRIVRWFGTCTYIHDMKQAEEALRRARDDLELRVRERTEELQRAYDALRWSEEKYRELVEKANSIILRMDARGHITFFNEFAQKFFGYTEEEILGRHVIGTIVPETDSSGHDLASCINRIVHYPEQCEYNENEVMKRSGERAWISWTNRAIYDEAGAFSGLLSVGSDTTEHRRAEERLRLYTAKLEQRNRELEDFAFISSHHVQEPLRKIMTFSDRLRVRCADRLDPEAEDYIHRMHKSVVRIQTLVQDLLRYSRISAETEGFLPVDLSTVVQDVLSALNRPIEEAGAQVQLSDLPTIDADRRQMRSLFTHLVENALKFRPEHAPLIKIHSRKKSLGGREFAEIHVEDNGMGFEEKYLDRIFTPFQQLHGRGRYEGTGIGLAICRRIAELHDGTITARSTPGKGSTFIVSLPLRQERREEPL